MDTIVKRSCGTCTACCKTHPVREISKPQGEWCIQCNIGSGCKVYEKRPIGCRKFECQWLKGSFEEKDRPDKTRIVTDFVHYPSIGDTFILFELSTGGLDKDFAASLGLFALQNGYSVLSVPVRGSCELLTAQDKQVGREFILEDGRKVQVKYV